MIGLVLCSQIMLHSHFRMNDALYLKVMEANRHNMYLTLATGLISIDCARALQVPLLTL